MDENLSNSFTGYLLEGPSSLSFQRFNISFLQRLGLEFFQVVNLSSLFQPFCLGLGLSVNVNLNALKLRVRPQIDRRLWTNGKVQMMIDLWEEKHWEYQRQPMVVVIDTTITHCLHHHLNQHNHLHHCLYHRLHHH